MPFHGSKEIQLPCQRAAGKSGIGFHSFSHLFNEHLLSIFYGFFFKKYLQVFKEIQMDRAEPTFQDDLCTMGI